MREDESGKNEAKTEKDGVRPGWRYGGHNGLMGRIHGREVHDDGIGAVLRSGAVYRRSCD